MYRVTVRNKLHLIMSQEIPIHTYIYIMYIYVCIRTYAALDSCSQHMHSV